MVRPIKRFMGMKTHKSSLKKVLAIDGGGIRGVIPAMILAEIEKRAQKPICELFDLLAGTSTGGILALGLTVPNEMGEPKYRAADLVKLYEQEGKNIFSRSIWHRVRSVGGIAEEKYPSEGIEKTLMKYFGKVRLKDALADVLVTSYDIERRRPYFFKTFKAKADPARNFLMWHACRATSAAPTYFEPCLIQLSNIDRLVLVDGGVFANNPAMCAWAEARRIYADAEDFLVVSLGTGELSRPYAYEDAVGWGLAGWVRPVLDVMFDGVSDATDYQLRQLMPTRQPRRYYRLQTKLVIGNDDMDDASNTNLKALKELAEELIQKHILLLDELLEQVTAD